MPTVTSALVDCQLDELVLIVIKLVLDQGYEYVEPDEISCFYVIRSILSMLEQYDVGNKYRYIKTIRNVVVEELGAMEEDERLEAYDRNLRVLETLDEESDDEQQHEVVDEEQQPEVVDLVNEVADEEATDETRGLECKICTVNKICVVLAKCGHVFCNSCTTRFENKCAVCRTPFTGETKIRMYI